MPEFPPWKRQLAEWTDAAQLRQSQLREAVSDLVARAKETGSSMVDELTRRVNVLGLATKHDVELQSRLGRNRVSYVLNEFLEAQRTHEEELVESLRSEFREELQGFAAAIDDDLFADDENPSATKPDEVDLVGDDSSIRRGVLETTDD